MLDKRRVNGPPGGTKAPVFATVLPADEGAARPKRSRKAKELRKMCTSRSIQCSEPS